MEYEVDKIVDKRKRWNRNEYRGRWKGYSPSEDTWEATKTLYKVKNLIADFDESKLNMPQENLHSLIKYRIITQTESTRANNAKQLTRKISDAKIKQGDQICVNLI